MADRATTVGLTLTAVGTTAAMIDRVLPPMHQVRSQPASVAATAQLRSEFLRTSAVVLAIGAGVATLARSVLPLAAVAATSTWLWFEYERAARADPTPRLR